MDFPDWIRDKGGPEAAALILGERPRTVLSWMRLERAPRLRQACRIVINTGGVVDFNGIFEPFARQLAEQDAAQDDVE